MTPLTKTLRKCLSVSISLSLVIQPIAAAEIILNQVTTQHIQQIQHQTDHEGQYALQLSPGLWNLTDQEQVVLADGEIPLGLFYRQNGQGALIFQVLKQPVIENEATSKPSHFHFYPDDHHQVTHGEMTFNSQGRLSFQLGEYGGTTRVQAKRVYINKPQNNQTHSTIKGSFFLSALKEIKNRSPLLIQGHFGLSTPTFHNMADIKAKGKGIIQINKGDNRSAIRFSQDSIVTGYTENTPFHTFRNHILASKTKLTLHGNYYEQSKKGRTFAAIALHATLETLKAQGDFFASLLYLHANKGMSFQGSLIQGRDIYFKTINWLGKDRPTVRARNGVQMDVKTLTGSGRFEVGASSAWAFPYHLFYEDASPKGKRSHKLMKAVAAYFSHYPQENAALFGCHINAQSFDLDDQTTFDIIGGPTHVKTTYANMRGKINTGPYNDHTISINAHELAFPGELTALAADIAAHRAVLSGEFDVRHFTVLSDDLRISGMVHGDLFNSAGRLLHISPSGLVSFKEVTLNHDRVSIDGALNTGQLTTQAQNFHVGSTGSVSCGQATLDNGQTSITGTMSVSSLDIHGNSIDVPGNLNASQVTNHAPYWNVNGKADIGSFSSSIPALHLSGGDNFSIRHAAINTLYATFGGRFSINNHNLHGNSLKINPGSAIKGHQWNLDLAHGFDQQGDLNLSHLSLATPYWHQSSNVTLQANHLETQVETANLHGLTNGELFQGFIGDLNLTGAIESSQVHLQGDRFNNEGRIQNDGGIGLAYNTYNLGNLWTKGTLALELNDRLINESLLKNFENQFGYKMLSLRTNQHLQFTQSIELYKSLALSAPSIAFESVFCDVPKTWNIHGDLMLESRNHALFLSHFNLIAQNGTFLSGSDFILNDSTIQTQQKLLFDIKGNTVLNRTNCPSLLSAGWEGMQGNVGGKFINNVSDLFSGGVMEILARLGFEFNAEEIHHQTSHTRKKWYGAKSTTTRWWNEIRSPTVTANGPVTFISPEGGAHFDSTKIVSPENITVATKGPVTNRERITYDNTVTKKNTLWSRKRTETKVQGDSPTVVASMEGVNITSWDDEINLPSTVIIAPEVLLEAEKDVRFTVSTLRNEFSYESSGWAVTHALSDIAENPMGTLMNLDGITGSLMSLYDVRSQHSVNQISAGVTAGISGYNAYKGYQNALANGGNLKSFAMSRLLSSLCTVQIRYHDEEVSAYETFRGKGGLYSKYATIHSQQGNVYTLNGFPLDVEKLTISCSNGSWFQQGFKREFGGSSDSFSMGVGFNLLTMAPTDVSMSASSSDSEGVQWIPQYIRDQNPTIEAKSVVNLNGVDSFRQSQSGFGFSVGANSFSGNINGYGFSYAAPTEEGMLGSFGVQAKGLNFVVPIMGADSKTQPIPAQSQKLEEKSTPIAKESPIKNQDHPTSSGSTRKKESSRPKITGDRSPTHIADGEEHILFNNTWRYDWDDDIERNYQSIPTKQEDKNYLMSALTGAKNGLVGLGESVWQLAKDVSFLYAGAEERANPWLNDEDYPSITDAAPYGQAKKNMAERIEAIKSTAKFVKDSAVIFTGALREAHMLEIAPWLEDQKVHNSFLSTPLYQQSDLNMTERFEVISNGYHYFVNQSTSYRIEKTFEFATPIFAPWGVFKAGQHFFPHSNIFPPSPQRLKRQSNFTPVVHDPRAGSWNLWDFNYSGYYPLDYPRLTPILREHMNLDPKAPYLVHGHGNPNSVLYTRLEKVKSGVNEFELIEKNIYLDHRQLANLIKRQADYKKGQPVVLYSCSTGGTENGFARRLADKIGAPVQAATGLITSPNFYEIFIANTTFDWQYRIIGKYKLKPFYGEFKTYYPGGWSPKNEVKQSTKKRIPALSTTAFDLTEHLGAYSIPKKANGVIKQKTPNQLNQEIYRGHAPGGIVRVDTPHDIRTGQVHIHFENGSAINKDGTWKDGHGSLTQKQKDWLLKNGWDLR